MPNRGTNILNLHSIVPVSRANGPGLRTVIWFQGCSLGCPSCFNPETHSHDPNVLISAEDTLQKLLTINEEIQGITITGGEPLEQPEELLRLLRLVRMHTKFSVLLFSGLTMDEITQMGSGIEIVNQVDALISGRFLKNVALSKGLRGSANQLIHLITTRYRIIEIENTPDAEIMIDERGRVTVSGVNDLSPCITSALLESSRS